MEIKLIEEKIKEVEKNYYNLKEKNLLCESEKKGIMFFQEYSMLIKLKKALKNMGEN